MYYRVVSEYLGEDIEFVPKNSYEGVDIVNNEIIEVDYRVKEVCFSKSILGCFFAISMYLEENKDYYIYKTDSSPCIDLSSCSIGDFKAGKEVRFRKPVNAKLIGIYSMREEFLYAINSLYCNSDYGNYHFDNEYALKMLDTHYEQFYLDINYNTESLFNYHIENYNLNKICN